AVVYIVFFFFQAEDGIRDRTVTGVQTCALPIFSAELFSGGAPGRSSSDRNARPRRTDIPSTEKSSAEIWRPSTYSGSPGALMVRSEERRVGKECTSGWKPDI